MSLATAGIFLAFSVAGALYAAMSQPQERPARQSTPMSSGLEACAKACSDCQRECASCSAHCASMLSQGKSQHLQTLQTCADCAEICAVTASIVARDGPFTQIMLQACADACARCAEACEKFPDDAHMKRCAEECRRCEQACKDAMKQGRSPGGHQHGK